MRLNHIYNEDCFDTIDRWPEDAVDLIVTSPPWNAKKNYGDYTDDNKPDFDDWLQILCSEMERVAKNALYVYMSQDHMWTLQKSLKGFRQWLFYHRRNLGATWHIRNPWIKTITPIAMSWPNGRLHPAQDPVAAYLPLIARTPCETVYDPFMGSGTTAMTCLQLGKNYIGSELNTDYIKIANKRINAFEAQETIFGIQEELISE